MAMTKRRLIKGKIYHSAEINFVDGTTYCTTIWPTIRPVNCSNILTRPCMHAWHSFCSTCIEPRPNSGRCRCPPIYSYLNSSKLHKSVKVLSVLLLHACMYRAVWQCNNVNAKRETSAGDRDGNTYTCVACPLRISRN